jgi:hypothetical protein
VPLHEGNPAPFTGVLMDPTTAAKIVADKEFEKSKCQLLIDDEKNKQVSKCDIERMTSEAILKSDAQQKKILVDLQEKEIVRLNKLLEKDPPAFGPLWYIAGTLSGILLSVTIFYAAVQITNDTGQD